MAFNWPYFLLGLALLWFPRRWMRMGKIIGRRRRKPQKQEEPWIRRESGDPRLSARVEFAKARNYFDLLRGGAGALAIMGGYGVSSSIALSAVEPVGSSTLLTVKIAILLVGLLIQTIRRESSSVTFFPPIFYVAGLSVSLIGLWAALFTFVLVWCVNPMLRNAHAFLSLNAAVLFAFGVMLNRSNRLLPAVAGLLCFLPALLSWMARRPLVVFSRKGVRPVGTS